MSTLTALTTEEAGRAKLLLAAKVASMVGRKLEEGDWKEVYCKAKNIPDSGWSNLQIDVNYGGLGIELKILRITRLGAKAIKDICGTTRMHPAATRSIRIDDDSLPANDVMKDVLTQYSDLIEEHTNQVREASTDGSADMRFGWLLWEDQLREFLYFEEAMTKPDPAKYTAAWNDTPARGARKASKSLWIFNKQIGAKRYSVTTSAGIKIQPYFDVPPPGDPNLLYFRVQSEPLDDDTVVLWVSAATAERLKELLGSTDRQVVSDAVSRASRSSVPDTQADTVDASLAVPIQVSKEAFDILIEHWEAVNDDRRIQQLIQVLSSDPVA